MSPVLEPFAKRLSAVPLRLRLVAIVLALLVTALSVSGVASGLLIRKYLTDRVDQELRAYADVAALVAAAQARSGSALSLLPPDYAVVVVPLSEPDRTPIELVRAASEPASPLIPALTDTDPRVQGGEPFSVGSRGGGSTTWRVVAGLNANGDAVFAVAKPLTGIAGTIAKFTSVAAAASIVVLLACALLGWYAVRRAFRPLRQIEDTAATIAGGDLTRRVPERASDDEIASLARSLNAMLAQIERSFAVREASEVRMRQFVADASHELRTPLATVRGYAELYRQGAVTEPDAVAGAMGRIESEAARMAGLVEDLLLLARLDGERPLERREVDLAVLAADAVQDAAARAPQRSVRLTGLSGPVRPTVVIGDEARLRQVFANIVANALTHTPDGTPIEVAVGQADATTAQLRVCDHGPGLDPSTGAKVFERFFRADPARSRAAGGGSGLGLAIVAAIVTAHGGRAGVSPTPGGGATFHVELPKAGSQASSSDHGARGVVMRP
ncbi:MAG: HAMP domain-containing sensor histidine kinase [Dermatophilaceae bacterium]